MLKVVLPLAIIACPVLVDVDTLAISSVVDPVPIVDVTIHMDELSVPCGVTQLPVSFINSAIRPCLLAAPVSETTEPLAFVHCARLKLVWRSASTFLSLNCLNLMSQRLLPICLDEVFDVDALRLTHRRNPFPALVPAPQSLQLKNSCHVLLIVLGRLDLEA